jgi:hypothetical protein
VTHMGEKKRYFKGFGRETWGENDHLNNLSVDGRIILKLTFK